MDVLLEVVVAGDMPNDSHEAPLELRNFLVHSKILDFNLLLVICIVLQLFETFHDLAVELPGPFGVPLHLERHKQSLLYLFIGVFSWFSLKFEETLNWFEKEGWVEGLRNNLEDSQLADVVITGMLDRGFINFVLEFLNKHSVEVIHFIKVVEMHEAIQKEL